MALAVFWSKRAEQNFERIIEYLDLEWGNQVTSAFVKKVHDFLDILCEFPELGSLEHPKRNIRGFLIVKQITVFYKIRGNSIILLNFFDNRQGPAKTKF